MSVHAFGWPGIWLVVALLINGVAPHPTRDYFNMARAPLDRYETSPFYQDSLLLPTVAHLLRCDRSFLAFLALCFGMIVCLFLLVGSVGRLPSLRIVAGAVLLPALAVHPVSQSLMNWIGSCDPITIGSSVVLTFATECRLLGLAAVIGSLNHPKMVIIALGIAWIRGVAPLLPLDTRGKITIVSSAFASAAAVRLVLWATGRAAMETRLDVMLKHGLTYWLAERVAEAPANLLSLYGGLLPPIIVSFALLWPMSRAYCLRVAGYSLAAFGIAFAMWDFTRVFGLLTVAVDLHLLASACIARPGAIRSTVRWRNAILLLVIWGAFMPRCLAWHRQVIAPAIPYAWNWVGGLLRSPR
ncbi:MAG: hypothetical protein U0527_16640 [Candidatus Eisenbacteria bacterium]